MKLQNNGLKIQGADPITRAGLFRLKATAHNKKGEYDKALEAANNGLKIKNLKKHHIECLGKLISNIEKNKTEVNTVVEAISSLRKRPRDEDSNENQQPRKKR